jgi:hypothetical protein
MTVPKPPTTLKRRGKALWAAVHREYELEEHEEALLLELCRCVDLCDELHAVVAAEGAIEHGTSRVHPAAVELRQQRIALARLQAALRLPAGDEDDRQQGARRPQRRVGARGVYGVATRQFGVAQ